MTTPAQRVPHNAFVALHLSMDERLDEAFRRYDHAFHALDSGCGLATARMDVSLILFCDAPDVPPAISHQLLVDGETLVRETPEL